MTIKFYPLKRNGEIAKTPIYVDSLDKEFCALYMLNVGYEHYRYSYSSFKSLYEIYLEILNESELDITGQMFVDKIEISTEKLKTVIKLHTNKFVNNCVIPITASFLEEMKKLEKYHEENVHKLTYCAFEMESNIDRFKKLNEKYKHIVKGKLIRLENPDEDNENYHVYKPVMDDILPIAPVELI